MKNSIKVLSILGLLVGANSCSFIYYPTYPVVPDATDNGFGLQGTIGLTKAQLSAWYAIDSNWYFTSTFAGAFSALGDADSNTTEGNLGSKAITVGAGYNLHLSNNADFNIQGGAGISQGYFRTPAFRSVNSNSVFGDLVNTQSTRIYLQPSFRIDRGKGGFYMIPRVTYESFTSVNPKKGNAEFTKRNFLITEFFLMGRFKLKMVNIDLYGGVAANTSNSNGQYEETWIAQPFVFGFGLSKTFGQ
ncbi:MAG: hypothetical protein ACKVQB_13635 [Bacteroidia bacterium]